MLVTRYFVFVHLPKTGGDFVRKVVREHLPDRWFLDTDVPKHGSLSDLDPALREDVPCFAAVRNPWDWHVSWYHYLMGSGREESHRHRVAEMNPFFVKASANFENDFANTMRNVYASEPDAGGMHADLRRRDIDMLTWHFERQVGGRLDSRLLTVGRAENLREDLWRFLASTRAPLSSSLRTALQDAARVNQSKRRPYQAYYDSALARDIGRRARSIVQRFGYSFDSPDDGTATSERSVHRTTGPHGRQVEAMPPG